MAASSAADSFDSIPSVIVPESLRPRLGSAQKTLPQLEKRLEAAWMESANLLRAELIEQIDALIVVAHCDGAAYDLAALQELLRRANNIRGMAEADGSELTSDIAHAIFEIVEGATSSEAPSKKTIGLLAEGCRGLLGFDRRAKEGALDEHVQRMLRVAYLGTEVQR